MSELELFGREEEVSTLQLCFQRMAKTQSTIVEFDPNFTTGISKADKELVFVLGHSGVGKSSLTRSLIKDVNHLDNALFVEGKFDLITSNEVGSVRLDKCGTTKSLSDILLFSLIRVSQKRSAQYVGSCYPVRRNPFLLLAKCYQRNSKMRFTTSFR